MKLIAFLSCGLLLTTLVLGNTASRHRALAMTAPAQMETGISASLLNKEHTLAVRYLPQFEATSLAPMVSVTSADPYWLGIQNETLNVMVRGQKFEAPLSQAVRWNGSEVPVPRWRHLAVTVGADQKVHVYQDGVSVCPNECFMAGSMLINGILTLGRRQKVANIQPQFNGLIDDVFLYSRVLSASEIAALAAGEAPRGSVASMTFDNT